MYDRKKSKLSMDIEQLRLRVKEMIEEVAQYGKGCRRIHNTDIELFPADHNYCEEVRNVGSHRRETWAGIQ